MLGLGHQVWGVALVVLAAQGGAHGVQVGWAGCERGEDRRVVADRARGISKSTGETTSSIIG